MVDEDEEDIIKPLPERLVSELTAERTLALRDALAQSPDTAFIALLHALCQSCFGRDFSFRNRATTWGSRHSAIFKTFGETPTHTRHSEVGAEMSVCAKPVAGVFFSIEADGA